MLHRAGPRRGTRAGPVPWQVVSLGLNVLLLVLLVISWRSTAPVASRAPPAGDLSARILEVEQRLDSAIAGRAWLSIGIPTVARKGNPRYLNQTLESLLEELPLDGQGEAAWREGPAGRRTGRVASTEHGPWPVLAAGPTKAGCQQSLPSPHLPVSPTPHPRRPLERAGAGAGDEQQPRQPPRV